VSFDNNPLTITTYSSFTKVIREFTAGEFYPLTRCFTLPCEAQENNETVVTAYLTVKADPTDADADALIAKTITTTLSSTHGQIVADGTNASLAEFKFYLQGTETVLLDPETPYFYDIKYVTSGSKPYVPERGRLFAYQGVTIAGT
jgi:hypothetical protein